MFRGEIVAVDCGTHLLLAKSVILDMNCLQASSLGYQLTHVVICCTVKTCIYWDPSEN